MADVTISIGDSTVTIGHEDWAMLLTLTARVVDEGDMFPLYAPTYGVEALQRAREAKGEIWLHYLEAGLPLPQARPEMHLAVSRDDDEP